MMILFSFPQIGLIFKSIIPLNIGPATYGGFSIFLLSGDPSKPPSQPWPPPPEMAL
jgi:hypothetical protein